MRVLPYSAVVLETSLGADEVRRRIEERIDPRRFYLARDPARPLRGRVRTRWLRLWTVHPSVIFDRSGGVAVVEGTCEARPPGAVLRLRIRPAWPFAAFSLMWASTAIVFPLRDALAVGRPTSSLLLPAMLLVIAPWWLLIIRRDARRLLDVVVDASAARAPDVRLEYMEDRRADQQHRG